MAINLPDSGAYPTIKDAAATKAMAEAAWMYLKETKDPYIKDALKAAHYKIPKGLTANSYDHLNFIGDLSHIMRIASFIHLIERAPYQYKLTDKAYYYGALDIRRSAKLSDHTPCGGEGVLTHKHRKEFARYQMDYYLKRFYLSFYNGLDVLLKDFVSATELYSSSTIERKEVITETVFEGLNNQAEQKMSSAQVQNNIASLWNILECGNSSIPEQDSSILSDFVQFTILNYQRANVYLDEFSPEKDARAAEKLQTALSLYNDDFIAAPESLFAHCQSVTNSFEAKRAQEKKIEGTKQSLEAENCTHPFTQDEYQMIGADDALRDEVRAYITAIEEDDEPLALELIESLTATFTHVASLDSAIQHLKHQQVIVSKTANLKQSADDVIDKSYSLAQRAAQEIELAALCQIKSSKAYGDVGIERAYMNASLPAATEDETSVMPMLGQNETTAQQLVALLRADLRCHGWDGQMPEDITLPSQRELLMLKDYPYSCFKSAYENAVPYAQAQEKIEADIAHRKNSASMLAKFLKQARPLLPLSMQEEIDLRVKQIEAIVIGDLDNISQSLASPKMAEQAEIKTAPA